MSKKCLACGEPVKRKNFAWCNQCAGLDAESVRKRRLRWEKEKMPEKCVQCGRPLTAENHCLTEDERDVCRECYERFEVVNSQLELKKAERDQSMVEQHKKNYGPQCRSFGPFSLPPNARHCIIVTTTDTNRYAPVFIYQGEISNETPKDVVDALLAAKTEVARYKLRSATRTPVPPTNEDGKEK